MTVVLATNQFPRFSETFIVRQFLGLLDLGWDMHVVCPSTDAAQWDLYPELRDRPDIRARVHVTRRFDEAIESLAPQLVHFEFGAVAIGKTEICGRAGCRQLVSFRGYDLNFFGTDHPHCYDEVWRHADALHLVSEALWRRAQERGCPPGHRHDVIHDAVDLDAFTSAGRVYPADVGTPERPLRILGVGRLNWKKGYEHSLQAARRLIDRGMQCEYRIIGEGDHREAVAYTVRDLGLEHAVRLEGARSHDEVRAALRWADVLLHSAVTEGFCVAVLEAQASGVPVVCTDAGGLPENVADGESAVVVARRDPAAAAEALWTLAQDPSLRRRMGENGRRRADRYFGFDRQIRRFDDLYRSLVGNGVSDPPTRRITVERADEHDQDVERVRETLEQRVPANAKVLVVSRGDDELVSFARWEASHFPQDASGDYAGYHPADSAEAIAQLEALRASGAEYLVFPPSARWWLDFYGELAGHLDRTARFLPTSPCVVVALA